MTNKNRIKLFCLTLFLVAGVVFLFTDNGGARTAHAFSGGPPASVTGAPGEQTCATSGCHTGTPDSGPGQFTISMVGSPPVYEPGETYQIRVTHTTNDNSRRRWGFQLTALTGDTPALRAGELASANNTTRALTNDVSGLTRQYIEHTSDGTFANQTGSVSWTFDWTAPDEDLGGIVLYAAGNQANGNGANSGDQIYTVRKAILSGPPVILSARVSGKRLTVTGRNFDIGAELLMNGAKQKKTTNDEGSLTTGLSSKKAGKKVTPGVPVTLQVRNPDGTTSEAFPFTRQ